MARDYMIFQNNLSGTYLQITGDDTPTETHKLQAASDKGQIDQAEEIINKGFFDWDPFPGFHWKRTPDGLHATDYDRKSR